MADETARHPNIVFIMADDMGYGDPGCYGAEKIPTPNMDRLAAEGMRFMDAHSSSAVCTPSRYSVMTGRYCWRTRLQSGVMWGYSEPLIEPDRLTVAEMLRGCGYATGAFGKWHLGLGWHRTGAIENDREEDGSNIDHTVPLTDSPIHHGFDTYWGIAASLDMPPYCFIEDDHTVGIPSVEKEPYNPQQRKGLMAPDWRDDLVDVTFAEKACEFIDRCRAEDPQRPFFVYLPASAPHRPCVPPDFMKGVSQAGPRGDMVAVYDWVVGQVMETLDRHGIADDTLLIVTSDNGARATCFDGNDYGHRSCGDLRGQKADIWDGGHREPFLVRWPGVVPAGTVCHETVGLMDLMATAADIVGCDLPADAAEDSVSILPALRGEELDRSIREATVHHSLTGMFALRQGPWKMIRGLGSGGFSEPRKLEPEPGGPEGQLYNLETDPQETTNLWQDEPAVVERLSKLLDQYIHEGRSVER
ncbi:MAG: arylsulfatase [Armatimonadetes bacterium]|nr:arylsulfatase [Armatimonadota bacterium]